MSHAATGTLANRKWVLKRRPDGVFRSDCLELQNESVDASSLTGEEIIVRVETLSIDAFLRTMLDEGAYHGEVKPGDTMTAMGMGTVIATGPASKFKIGKRVMGMLGAQEVSRLTPGPMGPMSMLKLPFVPNRLWLSILGLTSGLTAWVGLFRVLPGPKKSETACQPLQVQQDPLLHNLRRVPEPVSLVWPGAQPSTSS